MYCGKGIPHLQQDGVNGTYLVTVMTQAQHNVLSPLKPAVLCIPRQTSKNIKSCNRLYFHLKRRKDKCLCFSPRTGRKGLPTGPGRPMGNTILQLFYEANEFNVNYLSEQF